MPTLIPARYGKAVRLKAGEALKIINTHGNQVLDTWAFNANDPSEYMSMAHTRSRNSRIFVSRDDALASNHRRTILTIEQDTSPGRHDILLCACNAWIYRELGITAYHRSCSDNLHEALSEFGLQIPWTPSPLNLFMNVPVDPEGRLDRLPPESRPGDYVVLRTACDVIVAISSCPQDITAVNAGRPSDAEFEVIAAG
ncbi:urea carboxylase-associated family protein [Limobrevibacterium gyesilva]|uniref:Urea carboxylase-associated family protein n=1 Tax=Limobrevibacterium gyesilva TaxID=2991712 RepID=A0AA41YLT4_9PROT|nr:urea carboxylase-associated family protein [Limobrevibacterium gyesilva]MCW3476234.1 urea carboxylase-associated family protein [Limobrevibacterium gyesilva]